MFGHTSVRHHDLTPEAVAAQRAAAKGALRIIDVRERDEFVGDLGHIAGAELVPLGTVASVARAWPRDTPIVVVCRSGGRSARAAGELVAMGFTAVHNMLGGMLRWRQEGRPVTRSSD